MCRSGRCVAIASERYGSLVTMTSLGSRAAIDAMVWRAGMLIEVVVFSGAQAKVSPSASSMPTAKSAA